MLNIERSDKKPDPRLDEIRQDWRIWANRNGYTEIETIPIQYNMMNVALEILENPTQKDTYLLYLPSIPRVVGGETLYIIDNHEQLRFIVDATKKMVMIAMVLAQEKLKMRKYGLN